MSAHQAEINRLNALRAITNKQIQQQVSGPCYMRSFSSGPSSSVSAMSMSSGGSHRAESSCSDNLDELDQGYSKDTMDSGVFFNRINEDRLSQMLAELRHGSEEFE